MAIEATAGEVVEVDPRESTGIFPPLPSPIRRVIPRPGPLSPDVLQVIYLDEIAGRMEELQDLIAVFKNLVMTMQRQMEKAPVGRMRPYEKTITGNEIVRWEIKDADVVGRPCTCATIYNDGPDAVWVCLNELRDGFQKVDVDETLPFDFHGNALIERFFFKSTSGGTANLRIPLEY
jgi:hypothetical protein